MKKLIVVLSVAVLSIAGFAREPGTRFVVTKDGKFDCKQISFGMQNARIVLTNGKKSTIPIENINSYTVDGKQYDRLEMNKKGKDATSEVFMELVKTRDDLSLYRLSHVDYDSDPAFQTVDNYYVYQNGKLYLALSNKSLPSVLQYFDVKYAIASL
jgi:predicted CopG family antitoxin